MSIKHLAFKNVFQYKVIFFFLVAPTMYQSWPKGEGAGGHPSKINIVIKL